MRQQPSGRRPRGRSNRKNFVPHRSQTFDSHGPDVRVRGNAMQVYEKYVSLARDATAAGDRIVAESYQQYAEHYYRIINDTTDPQRPGSERPASERPASERPDGDRGAPERAVAERQAGGHQPYPIDAEQPFVDGGAIASVPGNGQVPEGGTGRSDAGEAASGEAASGDGASGDGAARDGAAGSPADQDAKPKPRGRGRPRSAAKAGNGAAADAGVEGAGAASTRRPNEAGEPTN